MSKPIVRLNATGEIVGTSPAISDDDRTADEQLKDSVSVLREVVCEHLGFEYWPRMEACLAVCAALRLAELELCVALVLIGASSSGKGTILDLFDDCIHVVRRDTITAAAFVGNAMGKTKSELQSNDLLPLLQNAAVVP